MFFRSISLASLLLLVSSRTLAEEFSPNDAPSGKRAPMGFQGMRGKKDLTSSVNEELDKRAPMGFQGMRGKKDSAADIEENLIGEELEKRSPMGFQGMRGKKDDLLTPNFPDSYFRDEYPKRAPMGFQGMRGKKTTLLLPPSPDDDYYRRISVGLRGPQREKSLDFILREIENGRYGTSAEGKNGYHLVGYPGDYEKRARAMGFQGMRGKRQELEDGWEKRASMGFQGMRGKKRLLEAAAEMEALEKRATMGFQGMRGKKQSRSGGGGGGYYDDDYRPEQSAAAGYLDNAQISDGHELEKRESVKREATGLRAEARVKREATGYGNDYPTIWQHDSQDTLAIADDDFLQTGLRHRADVVPLRFDKRSTYGYFRLRGKKIPHWGLRRKFVGVRGKKWSPTANNSLLQISSRAARSL